MKACIALLMLLSLTACDLRIKDPAALKDKLDKCASVGMTSLISPLGNNDYSFKCI